MKTIPRKIKDYLISYVHQYADQSIEKGGGEKILNNFQPTKAALAAINKLQDQDLTEKELAYINSRDGRQQIVTFFKEKLPTNYFMKVRDIPYSVAKGLLIDKGSDFFIETRGLKNSVYPGKIKTDYPATEKQIEYIKNLNYEINHLEELSSREARIILLCINNSSRPKPFYFDYYVKKHKEEK